MPGLSELPVSYCNLQRCVMQAAKLEGVERGEEIEFLLSDLLNHRRHTSE